MKNAKDAASIVKTKVKNLGRSKYIWIAIVFGIVLLLLPARDNENTEQIQNDRGEEEYSLEEFEKKLEETLSDIDGAGKVSVVLTVYSDARRVYAQDESLIREDGTEHNESKTVVVSTGSGVQEAVLVQNIFPKYRGALIVAAGGGDPEVRLKITQAVAAVTGLGTDKISVCKGK